MLLKKYGELLESILTGLKGGEQTATLSDYLQTVGISLLFVGIIVLTVLLVYGAIKLTMFIWDRVALSVDDEINKIKKGDWKYDDIKHLKRKLTFRKVVCVIGFILFYVPVLIPTLLAVIDMLIRVFA